MMELVFVACLTTSPITCEERIMLFHGVTQMTCMMGAQSMLAKWADAHPGFTISRWKCRPQRREAYKI